MPSEVEFRNDPPRERHLPNVMAADCPSRVILNHITSRWGGLILIALRGRTVRFSELRRCIGGVSERMLALTLQTLEADGFVHRRAFDVVPPHVEYNLTPLGSEIADRIADLSGWIESNLHRIPSAG
jgi:DNA-binding HxlR family transcriptional regulator